MNRQNSGDGPHSDANLYERFPLYIKRKRLRHGFGPTIIDPCSFDESKLRGCYIPQILMCCCCKEGDKKRNFNLRHLNREIFDSIKFVFPNGRIVGTEN